jgi:hypothetical protein
VTVGAWSVDCGADDEPELEDEPESLDDEPELPVEPESSLDDEPELPLVAEAPEPFVPRPSLVPDDPESSVVVDDAELALACDADAVACHASTLKPSTATAAAAATHPRSRRMCRRPRSRAVGSWRERSVMAASVAADPQCELAGGWEFPGTGRANPTANL